MQVHQCHGQWDSMVTVVPAHVLACAASEGLEILFLVSLLSPLPLSHVLGVQWCWSCVSRAARYD